MATITFFGKPNCINNQKQKSLLKAAGHDVIDQDILNQNWQPDELQKFFQNTPVCQWFNMTAPAIKAGVILVDEMSSEEAIEAMIDDPLLIRRPLMEVQGRKLCGFRYEELERMIGLSPIEGQQDLRDEDMIICPFLEEAVENCDERKVT